MNNVSKQDGHSSNAFDFLRILAASVVLYSHSYPLYGLVEPKPIAGQTWGSLAVALFFALSCFLVCQSWTRDPSIGRFFVRRGLRIFPGLLVMVLLTALVLGPVFTTASLGEYFGSGTAWQYIRQAGLMLGSPKLLGVFDNNPYPGGPNGSLWTLRYEMLMYLALAMLGRLFPVAKLRIVFPLVFLVFGAVWLLITLGDLEPRKLPFLWRIGTEFYIDTIASLGAFFFAGACMNLFIHKIPLSRRIALTLALIPFFVGNDMIAIVLLWIAIPYAGFVFAFKAPAVFMRLNGRDYSYGIYIYAFPVQQAVSLIGSQHGFAWLTVLLISALVTVFLAAFSWHLIERPALSLKSMITSSRRIAVPEAIK